MDLLRIGDKLVSVDRIQRQIDRALDMRAQGMSQQDVADEIGVDRTFISRLEGLGEVRKGGKLALIGMPVGNKEAVEQMARDLGVDFVLVMTDQERYRWVDQTQGAQLFNELLDLIAQVQDYDAVIFAGSDRRIRLLEALIGSDRVVGIELGKSPIKGDRLVDIESVKVLIENLRV